MALEDEANRLRLNLMGLGVAVAPLHEWLAGELAYFRSQGYTDREAHAMAAATYLVIFGGPLHLQGGPDGRPPGSLT